MYYTGGNVHQSFELVFNTDSKKFGGSGERLKKTYAVKNGPMHGYEHYIELKLPPMTTIYLKPKAVEKKVIKKASSKKTAGRK